MSQDTPIVGLIVSSVKGVVRMGPDGKPIPLVGKLNLTSEISVIARSLIPSLLGSGIFKKREGSMEMTASRGGPQHFIG